MQYAYLTVTVPTPIFGRPAAVSDKDVIITLRYDELDRSNQWVSKTLSTGVTTVQWDHLDLRICTDECLLVDTAHTLQVAHVEGVLQPQIARMCRFDFSTNLVIVRFFLQNSDLNIV
nr:hypothetical protein CfBp_00038 [Serratia proteamaculans]